MQDLQPLVLYVLLVLILAVYQLVVDELVFLARQLKGLSGRTLTLR